MFLVGADEQGSGKSIEALHPRYHGGHGEAEVIAIAAALSLMPHHHPKIADNIVAVRDNEGEICLLGEAQHCLQSTLVFGEGVDIRIIPKGSDLQPLLLPMLDAVGGTGRTTGMKE